MLELLLSEDSSPSPHDTMSGEDGELRRRRSRAPAAAAIWRRAEAERVRAERDRVAAKMPFSTGRAALTASPVLAVAVCHVDLTVGPGGQKGC